MSALKQNPFLVGFGVVMAIGIGALGYLTYSASDEYSKANDEFQSASAELKRLQGGKPYPDKDNLKKVEDQKKALQAKINELQSSLSSLKLKVEDISPTGFQDKLRDTVARIAAKAQEANVKLPATDKEKFYLGFNVYQGEPPKGPAAPPLYRELRAIESVMNLILETKNVEVKELVRSEIKEEKNPKPAASTPGNKNKQTLGEDGPKLLEKENFTIKFSTTQENFQRILNGIVTHKEQFFIPRYVVIQNEKPDAPAKQLAVAAVPSTPLADNSANPAAANPAGAAGAPAVPEAPKLEYVFGKELVEVTLELDLVDVKEPQVAAADKAAPKNK